MSTVSYYTAEGLKKLREELDYLKSVMRPKASADIAEARDKGDLSENAEYATVKQFAGSARAADKGRRTRHDSHQQAMGAMAGHSES